MNGQQAPGTSVIVKVVITIGVVVGLIALGWFYGLYRPGASTPEPTSQAQPPFLIPTNQEAPIVSSTVSPTPLPAAQVTGVVLAGTSTGSLLLDFNQADYEQAKTSKKVVVLYFYANWCPICKIEFPKMTSVFNTLNDPAVIGFRVNFNDNETDSFEQALAQQFLIPYQHTKVMLNNGQPVLTASQEWTEEEYRAEIQKALLL